MAARRVRKSWTPELLRLETRDVPTVISPLAFGGAGLKAQKSLNAAAAVVSSSPTTAGNPSPAPIDLTQLSKAGLARSKFIAHGTGPFAVSPSSYINQTHTIIYIGPVASNQFLQGTLVIRLDTPTVLNGTITGFAALRDRNVAATGNILVLDLTITAEDKLGRPTHLDWTVDDNGSGGTYSGAAGSGTLTITYTKFGHAKEGAGIASTLFTGNVLGNGVNTITDFTLNHFN